MRRPFWDMKLSIPKNWCNLAKSGGNMIIIITLIQEYYFNNINHHHHRQHLHHKNKTKTTTSKTAETIKSPIEPVKKTDNDNKEDIARSKSNDKSKHISLRTPKIDGAEKSRIFGASTDGSKIVDKGMSIPVTGEEKKFKDEVENVQSGQECGMAFSDYEDVKADDVIEIFKVDNIARTIN